MTSMELEKLTLLIVDDDKLILRALSIIFEQAGYTTLTASDAQEALALADEHCPDLIVSDIVMPQMDGFELSRRLKTNPHTENIPIIFVTGLSATEDKISGFDLGAVDYITKPFQPREVIARIKSHVTMARLRQQLQEKNAQLEAALLQVKLLTGLLPICANCKKIRDDEGYWHEVTNYIEEHSDVEFTHGVCPMCIDKLYPGLFGDVS